MMQNASVSFAQLYAEYYWHCNDTKLLENFLELQIYLFFKECQHLEKLWKLQLKNVYIEFSVKHGKEL